MSKRYDVTYQCNGDTCFLHRYPDQIPCRFTEHNTDARVGDDDTDCVLPDFVRLGRCVYGHTGACTWTETQRVPVRRGVMS